MGRDYQQPFTKGKLLHSGQKRFHLKVKCEWSLSFRLKNCRCFFMLSILFISVRPKLTEDGFKATLRERNASMFLNEWLADVHFIVGSVSITIL